MATLNPIPLPVSETDGANTTLGAQADAAAGTDAGTFTLMSVLKRVVARMTTLIALLPAALGQTTMSASLPVVLPSNQSSIPITSADGGINTIGAQADAAASADTGTFTLMAVTKRIVAKLTSLIALFPTALGQTTMSASLPVVLPSNQSSIPVTTADGGVNTLGSQADTAAGTDAGTFTMVSIVKRLVARWTTFFSLIPSALGPGAPSASFLVTMPNDVTVTGATATAINTDLLTGTVSGWYDAANFHSMSFNLITVGTITAGVVTFEQTNDTTNASAGVTVLVFDPTSLNQNPVTSLTLATSSVRQFEVPIISRYVRLRISTGLTGGGTVQTTAVLSQLPYSAVRSCVNQATSGNLQVTSTPGALSGTSNGNTIYRNLSLGTTGQSVKGSAGRLLWLLASNSAASARFVKVYNKATAPTVGTDTPSFTFPIAAGQSVMVIPYDQAGTYLGLGIGLGASNLIADADATAPTANDVVVNGIYA